MVVGLLSPGMTQMAGRPPLLGRGFLAADTAAAAARVALLSASFWKESFGGQESVIGTTVELDHVPYTVIGVLPGGFRLPNSALIDAPAVWLPITDAERDLPLQTIVRLRAGIASTAAAAELTAIHARESAARGTQGDALTVRLVEAGSPGTSSRAFLLMWVAGGLLLLVACVGAAHLVLFREFANRRANAIRAALGATWGSLARETLAEYAKLVGFGSLLGSAAGWTTLQLVLKLRPPRLAALDGARVDWRVAAASAVVALLLTLAVSGFALWKGGRAGDTQVLLRDPQSSPSVAMRRIRDWLVMTEMGLSAVLLVGATALLQALSQLESVNLGFSPAGVVGVRMDDRVAAPPQQAERQRLTAELAARVRRIPGVVGVATGDNLPPSLGYVHGTLEAEGELPIRLGTTGMTQINRVSAGYFAVLGMRLTAGTTFQDTSAQSADIVINEACAKLLWPEGTAVGRHLRLGQRGEWKRVVGVVADAALAGPYVDAHQPAIFAPSTDRAGDWVVFRMRDDGGRGGAAPLLFSSGIPAPLPLQTVDLARVLDAELAPVRFAAAVVNWFAALTVFLSAAGLYGVLVYAVTLRRKEFAIRMALGATAPRIAGRIVAHGMTLVCCGAVAGAVAGHWVCKMLATLVPVTPAPGFTTYGASIGALLAIGLIACAGPTWAAARTPPRVMLAE